MGEDRDSGIAIRVTATVTYDYEPVGGPGKRTAGTPEEALADARNTLMSGQVPPDAYDLAVRTSGTPTDTETVDALVLGLGTKSEWGNDDYDWITVLLGMARPGIIAENPRETYEAFKNARHRDPLEDSFLSGYVSEEIDDDVQTLILCECCALKLSDGNETACRERYGHTHAPMDVPDGTVLTGEPQTYDGSRRVRDRIVGSQDHLRNAGAQAAPVWL